MQLIDVMIGEGGGECGALLRQHDWATNPLGEPRTWPTELKTLVAIVLASHSPMYVVWGPQQIVIYNDANAQTYGKRHPAAFARPFREVLSEHIWPHIEPHVTAAYNGISTSRKNAAFIMNRNDYEEETFFSFSYTPVRSATGEVLGLFCSAHEMTAEMLVQREKENERKQLRDLFETALGAVAVLRGPNHVFSFTNPEYEEFIGHRDLIGRAAADALPELVTQGFTALADEVYATGKPHIGKGVRVALQRNAGVPMENRIVDFVYHPVFDDHGKCEGIFVQAIDITDQHLLNRELAHRLKNQLTIVQALVSETLRTGKSAEEMKSVLNSRIAVLARSHDAVISGHVTSRSVDAVVRNAVEWQNNGRILVDGPELPMASRPALSLSLVLHELLTNALKYGALSNEDGTVRIVWATEKVEGVARLVLRWEETGGPEVRPPSRQGLGARLIRAGLSGTRNTRVALDFNPEGVCCEIATDLAALQTEQ